jgi:hypothetical protein
MEWEVIVLSKKKLSEEEIREIVGQVVKKELPLVIEGFREFLGISVLLKEAELRKGSSNK